jgi:hypothetical protein
VIINRSLDIFFLQKNDFSSGSRFSGICLMHEFE